MGMRFTGGEGQDRFATVVGGRPGRRGADPVEVSPALRAFLARLFDDEAARRAFLTRRAEAIAADPVLDDAERDLLRSIPEEKVRAIETMIPPPSALRRATVLAAGVTALAVFLGLALPARAHAAGATPPAGVIVSDADRIFTAPPGGIRPDFDDRLEITKGIRPGPDDDSLQVVRGIRPTFDPIDEDDPGLTITGTVDDKPMLPRGTSEVVTTGEVTLPAPGAGTGETGLAPGAVKPVKPGVAVPPKITPPKIDRPNVTRGIRPGME